MSAANYCCVHQQERLDSPEPPARPLAAIDGIFAAAVLPEDHPDAIKFPERKAETDATIVQSPSLTSKIKLQFQRKSVKNLKKGKEYDDDARQLSLQEVLDDLRTTPHPTDEENEIVGQRHRFGSVLELDKPEPAMPEATKSEVHLSVPKSETTKPEVRSSVLQTLGYLQPLLQKSSYSTDTSKTHARPTSTFPKSLSSPSLPLDEVQLDDVPRRSCSASNLLGPLFVRQPFSNNTSEDTCYQLGPNVTIRDASRSGPIDSVSQSLHIQEPPDMHKDRDAIPCTDGDTHDDPGQNYVPHLHNMEISEQLRSMSQMSETVEESCLSNIQPWTFHYRERSHVAAPAPHGRHLRQTSSSGLDSTTVPLAWGKVRAPIRDTASSIYSRPVSANANEQDMSRQDTPVYDNLNDLHALFADWPLKPLASTVNIHRGSEPGSGKRTGDERDEKPLPPIPADSRKDSGTTSFVTAVDDGESSSGRFLSSQRRDTSIPSKRSSSTLTKASKQSKFLERFSPPKKTVRKRLSVFRFLRPGSRKRQIRSISSPILHVNSGTGAYDGHSEDPGLLTVQYELADQPNQMTRSASMVQLGTRSQDLSGHLTRHHMLQRQPTLADYERNLSAAGDDRRRPSTINIQRVKEIQEDDHRDSLALKKKLRRARPLKDDVSPLMAQALEKHQQEKALFRSASKRRESSKDTYPGSVVSSSPITRVGSSLPPPSITDYNEMLDPMEKGQLTNPVGHRIGSGHLLPPGSHASASSRRTSPAASIGGPSTRTSITGPMLQPAPQSKKRIGTSLDSWSRYPSHTRAERCGSAGRPDAVLTRDFAVDINPDEIQGSEDTQTESSDQEKFHVAKSRSQRSKASLPKSRSMMFSGIVRYYSNLFHTRDWYGQNRRTSVTTGGRLEYPELEMLPPQVSTESPGSHKHSEHLKRFEERIMEDASKVKHYLQEEENKLEGYMRKEEKAIEGFVTAEEHRFSDFVRKEEERLKEFVVEEEDRFKHHHRHEPSSRSSSRQRSPYLTGAVFKAPSYQAEDHLKRSYTSIAPNDDVEKKETRHVSPEVRLALDGSAPDEAPKENQATSKAEIWSNLYKECLLRPISRAVQDPGEPHGASTGNLDQSRAMPPPALRPVKPRTPERPKALDPQATIRRFPSVTVIDDRKGHGRSISLVSVKTSRSTGFDRTSTQDLVELIQAREREEREKLLKAIDTSNQT